MPKRFTATEKWDDPWFRKLPNDYKCFWDFLCSKCDQVGIWKVDFEMVKFCLKGVEINPEEALSVLNDGKERVHSVERGDVWMLVDFIQFQYGTLSYNNSFHRSIITRCEKLGVSKGCPRGVIGHKVKEREKVKVKDVNKGSVVLFTKPTVEEVEAYCRDRKNGIDAQYFFDRYEANGWVDKNGNKMKDWKATVRTWEKFTKDKKAEPKAAF